VSESPALPPLRGYLRIARFDHWIKNLLVLPGAAFAVLFTGEWPDALVVPLVGALLSTGLVASANYVVNEWLDAETDRFHPAKRDRPAVQGGLSAPLVALEYAVLLVAGLTLGLALSPRAAAALAVLAGMGLVYNVRPLRTKDRVYLDVLSESVNNPLRLLVGWFAVAAAPLPPASLLFGYWMVGAYLMSVKRYSELRTLGSPETAGLYRRSFRFYTPETLLVQAMFYVSCASFFLGVLLVKYRVEILLVLPFMALAFAWYLYIGTQPDSRAQAPEQLYREVGFTAYLALIALLLAAAFVIDFPALEWLLRVPDY